MNCGCKGLWWQNEIKLEERTCGEEPFYMWALAQLFVDTRTSQMRKDRLTKDIVGQTKALYCDRDLSHQSIMSSFVGRTPLVSSYPPGSLPIKACQRTTKNQNECPPESV